VAVVLVTRIGCHLCDGALAALRELGIEPEQQDVDADEALLERFDWRVPVVLVDGKVVAEGKVDSDTLRARLGR
jgi:predicted thioredoxin/glutaredoxin